MRCRAFSLRILLNASGRRSRGEVRWEFRREGASVVVRVYWDDGGESLTGDYDLLHFCSEVSRELDSLLATWGEEGYLKKWMHPFPREAQLKLKQGIKVERERRQAAE
jgi:hypothetical protein